MFYGIEQSTDLRCPLTVIKKFTTIKPLLKWMENEIRLTYADPESAGNYHHTIRYGYELRGRINKKDPIFLDRGTSTYPQNNADNMATYLRRNGEEVEFC